MSKDFSTSSAFFTIPSSLLLPLMMSILSMLSSWDKPFKKIEQSLFMTKAGALKKRYIAFEYRGQEKGEKALRHAIYAEALKFFGEYGLSEAALKLVEYDSSKKRGILRCGRSYADRVLGFLSLVDSLSGSEARLVPLKSSGTLKSLESVMESIH
ncbi:hypothetical protein GF318_00720 [Candidatus Micrarchaeota archaeon]|nr:hypothetical protein [Candidatus Micrarchaeota archaeon]